MIARPLMHPLSGSLYSEDAPPDPADDGRGKWRPAGVETAPLRTTIGVEKAQTPSGLLVP